MSTVEVTRLWCSGLGLPEGSDNSTHHLVVRTARGERIHVCRGCGRTEAEIRRTAEIAATEAARRARHDEVMDTADAVVREARTRDLLRTAYALTHRIHEARKPAAARGLLTITTSDTLSDLMASREVVSTEIRRRTQPVGHARALGLFLAPDGEDEPTLWQDRRTQDPVALCRRCDVHEHVWALLASTVDTRAVEE